MGHPVSLSFLVSGLLLASACASPIAPRSGGGACEAVCTQSSECSTGEVCDAGGCCVDAPREPVCYDPDGCIEAAQICAQNEGGCECQVTVGNGLGSGGDPRLVLEPGRALDVRATLYVRAPVAQALTAVPDLKLVSVRDTSLTLEGDRLIAGTAAGAGKLEVSYPGAATCYADVVNLGPRPPSGALEVYVYNQLTGQPVDGAIVVADGNGDGIDDEHAMSGDRRTNTQGVAGVEANGATHLTVTVFALGHRYVTVSGVPVSLGRISLPVAPVREGGWLAGATGRIDFASYVKKVRRGIAGSISAGIVAPAIDMDSLMRFELTDLFGGPLIEVDCAAGGEGCYSLELPGLISEKVGAWGGMVFGFPTGDVKPHFAVAGAPGLRRAWSLAGQWEVSDVDDLLRDLFISGSACACNTVDTCEASCSCDTDCKASVPSRMFRAALPFVSQSALGVSGPLDLVAAPRVEWQSYLDTAYAQRPTDSRFPVLDSAVEHRTGPSVAPVHAMSRYTTLSLPSLPTDPVSGEPFEGMVAFTGILAPGTGVVPLGIGAGFDCTEGGCPGRARWPSAPTYDGVINGGELCVDGAVSLPGGCPGEHPVLLPAGSIPLVYARAPEGIGLDSQRTLVLALPLDSIGDGPARAAGFVVEGSLPEGSVSWSDRTFPAFPNATKSGRVLSWTDADVDVRRLELDGEAGGPGWTVWSFTGESVTLPEAPSGYADPWHGTTERRWITSGLALRAGLEAEELLGLGQRRLPEVGNHLRGFATQHHMGAW